MKRLKYARITVNAIFLWIFKQLQNDTFETKINQPVALQSWRSLENFSLVTNIVKKFNPKCKRLNVFWSWIVSKGEAEGVEQFNSSTGLKILAI